MHASWEIASLQEGLAVGVELGTAVGAELGSALGAALGLAVGSALGVELGEELGVVRGKDVSLTRRLLGGNPGTGSASRKAHAASYTQGILGPSGGLGSSDRQDDPQPNVRSGSSRACQQVSNADRVSRHDDPSVLGGQ